MLPAGPQESLGARLAASQPHGLSVSKTDELCIPKTRNCVSKTRRFVSKMMNSAAVSSRMCGVQCAAPGEVRQETVSFQWKSDKKRSVFNGRILISY